MDNACHEMVGFGQSMSRNGWGWKRPVTKWWGLEKACHEIVWVGQGMQSIVWVDKACHEIVGFGQRLPRNVWAWTRHVTKWLWFGDLRSPRTTSLGTTPPFQTTYH